ncbi:uncharacterized protein LOC115808788 [Chanos chanos]|uniref:Uncharacterized protein LOC115808788 n=1 Tax=Chanos chanos TaxID=29144 RepID=A0A6J2V4I1_CHACN|nr:uncharacterized protein LOC115808788 [Chanos chanos]
MEISWFKGTDCIYQYKNGELRDVQRTDGGEYRCEVIYGEEKKVTLHTHLIVRHKLTLVDKPVHRRRISSSSYQPKLQRAPVGEDVTLSCYLSPETSAVTMEIRWFKGTDCIYQYKNGEVREGRGYEGRVSLIMEELQRGNVSLTLRDVQWTDGGEYRCEVISGEEKLTFTALLCLSSLQLIPGPEIKKTNTFTLNFVRGFVGKDVIIPYHLSPETSAVTMEIRWFRGTECIYKYENGEVREGRGYEGRVSLIMEELQRGNVSLTLRDFQETDTEVYNCEVIYEGDKKLTSKTHLYVFVGGERPSLNLPVSPELRLVLLGLSETVKWAAGNTILGREEFGIQAATSTETQHSESRQGEVAGRQLVVVDTPDWLSPGLSQEEMRKDVGLCVRLSAPGPHTFLLVYPLEPSEGEESELLEKLEDIFGDKCWGHTMILFINTEGLREINLEEVIQMKSHGFQQLMEKCGNRCHLLNVKNRDETEVTELLQKIEEMVSKNQEKFYSSDVYQEAVERVTEINIFIEKEKKNRREKEEKELERKHEMDKQDYVIKMEQQNKEKDEKISELEKRIAELEKELENEKNENRKKELEKQLEEEKERRREIEREREKLRKDMEREIREKEDIHKEELEEIREKYEMEAKAEAERNLMKIILPELQSKLISSLKKLQSEFNIKTEEKDEEMKRMMQILEEKERRMERVKYILEEKDREMETMKEKLDEAMKRLQMTKEIVRMRQDLHSLSRGETSKEAERLKQGLDHLTDTSTQLEEIYKK